MFNKFLNLLFGIKEEEKIPQKPKWQHRPTNLTWFKYEVGFTAPMCFFDNESSDAKLFGNDPMPATIKAIMPDGKVDIEWHHFRKASPYGIPYHPSCVIRPESILCDLEMPYNPEDGPREFPMFNDTCDG